MPHDAAALEFFDKRRVTRDQFENFERSPRRLPPESSVYILENLDRNKKQQLLNIGKSVCRIDIRGTPEGSGFHLGGGWVMTNQHVICEGDAVTSSDCCLKFVFPDLTVLARPRKVLFSHFTDPEGTPPVDESRKDLALVYVEELDNPRIPALTNVDQRQADQDERVYLIHYGDGTNQPSPPQQFSCGNVRYTVRNQADNVITVHDAHCRPGSSGAPLLVYGNSLDYAGFVVAGVHFAPAPGYERDSPGLALLFCRDHWLRNTLLPVKYMDRMYIDPQPVIDCRKLQKKLAECSMRAQIPRDPPDGVNPQDFPDIIWKPYHCNRT